jgi:hypothetical protein
MKNEGHSSKMLLYQGSGFIALIALSWINESMDLRTLILGEHPYISDFRESTLEMLFVLGVWFVVYGSTRRLLNRSRELESFMRVCSWCRRIGCEGHWLPVEEFFIKRLDTKTSHGICEECFQKQEAALIEAKRQLHLPSLETAPSPKPAAEH